MSWSSPAALAAGSLLENENFLWATAGLVGVLLVGALAISMMDRWRRGYTSQAPPSAVELLADFRSSYERGEMSEEEFQRIKAKLAPKLRQPADPPPPPPPPAPPDGL